MSGCPVICSIRFCRRQERTYVVRVSRSGDEMTERFRGILGRRYFVDRESGVLLIWVPADRRELAELVLQLEARHPGIRLTTQETGSAVAVRMSGREQELADLEALYVEPIEPL